MSRQKTIGIFLTKINENIKAKDIFCIEVASIENKFKSVEITLTQISGKVSILKRKDVIGIAANKKVEKVNFII